MIEYFLNTFGVITLIFILIKFLSYFYPLKTNEEPIFNRTNNMVPNFKKWNYINMLTYTLFLFLHFIIIYYILTFIVKLIHYNSVVDYLYIGTVNNNYFLFIPSISISLIISIIPTKFIIHKLLKNKYTYRKLYYNNLSNYRFFKLLNIGIIISSIIFTISSFNWYVKCSYESIYYNNFDTISIQNFNYNTLKSVYKLDEFRDSSKTSYLFLFSDDKMLHINPNLINNNEFESIFISYISKKFNIKVIPIQSIEEISIIEETK